MKRWALVVGALYGLILVVLTAPVAALAFAPKLGVWEAREAFQYPFYWLWIGVMMMGQAGLLAVPVRVASRRPVSHRSLLLPITVAGLMMGGLAVGALYSIFEFRFRDKGPASWMMWAAIVAGVVIWAAWAIVFYRASREGAAPDVLSRQCRLLLQGSILELLIAVPTHIVARCRDYCCAGALTFVGITLGISVMLFSFGPAVFFLYAARWRRLHPAQV